MANNITTTGEKVDKLIRRIADGDIKIPPLQRPFVWSIDQILKFLQSIYCDYPIGSVLLWETNDNLPSTRSVAGFKIPEKKPEYPHNYVLDGQQRLSTLYGVFCSDREQGIQQSGYEVDTECFNVLFDLSADTFIHSKERSDGKYFEAQNLIDSIKFLSAIDKGSYTEEEKEKLKQLHSIFINYEIPIVTTKKRSKEEVGVIFERINNSGTSLGLFDLVVAWTWTEQFHLREEFNRLFIILDEKNFSNIDEKIILQCLSAILKESSATKMILKLKPEEVRDNFHLLVSSLEKTVDYLSTELSVKSIQFLPHSHQIVPLCYLFSKINTTSESQKKTIAKWFWKTSFSDRYASSTDSHIDEDIQSFKQMVDHINLDTIFSKLNYSVSNEQLIGTKFNKGNSFTRAFIVLSAGNRPKDLTNGANIDVEEALSSFNKKEFHHIFPKDFLIKRGVELAKINSLCNICFLPAASNKLISNQAPSKYFDQLIPKSDKEEILESNLIPIKMELYKTDNFDLFLQERSRKIIEYIDRLLI